MDHEDFYELFIEHLRDEIDDDEYVNNISRMIDENRFSKANFMKLIKEDES